MAATRKKPAAKAKAPAPRKPAAPAASRLPPPPRPRKPAARSGKVSGAQPTAQPAKAAESARAEKLEKDKKPKLVRDSFTIPKPEYAVLEALKERAGRLGRPTKKSELLRAGIKALAAMGDADFLTGVAAVPAVKTGRPAKD